MSRKSLITKLPIVVLLSLLVVLITARRAFTQDCSVCVRTDDGVPGCLLSEGGYICVPGNNGCIIVGPCAGWQQ